jgi:hypothetical protein
MQTFDQLATLVESVDASNCVHGECESRNRPSIQQKAVNLHHMRYLIYLTPQIYPTLSEPPFSIL